MNKDARYEQVKTYIELGKITEFSQITNIISKTVIRHDLSMSAKRINDVLKDPGKLTGDDFILLGELIEVHPSVIVQLMINQKKK